MAKTPKRLWMVTGLLGTAIVAVVCIKAFAEGLTCVNRTATEAQAVREEQVMQAAGMTDWPQSTRITAAPSIDRSFLSQAGLASDERGSFGVVVLDNADCGMAHVLWRHRAASGDPVPSELPPDRREALDKFTKDLSAEARQEHYDRALAQYRQSKAVVESGSIDMRMVVAGSNRAAQEWLIFESTQCSLPTVAVAKEFGKNRRVEGLGDVAFKNTGVMRFVRGNIAVVVRGRGDCIEEIDKLASKIDAAISQEPAATSLEAMRPKVATGSVRTAVSVPESSGAHGQKACPFTATVGGGQKIAHVKATVNGEYAAAKDGEVLLGSAKGQVQVKVQVITDGLLVGSATQTVQVDGE